MDLENVIGVFGAMAIPIGIGCMCVGIAFMMAFSAIPQTDYQSCLTACKVSIDKENRLECISSCNAINCYLSNKPQNTEKR